MPLIQTRTHRSKLTARESARLTALEDVIATAERWQQEAARALVEIRDRKLYRASHPTFESYVAARWSVELARAYQLAQFGETLNNLSDFADSAPNREAHARALYSLSPDDQRRAWRKVLKETDEERTARDVERVTRSFRSPVSREHTGALVYYGSKAALAPQIIAQLPKHHCFVETHAGGAAVTLAKSPSKVEVLNDIDDALVNFYQVLREQQPELVRRLKRTPYARTEWDQCRGTVDDPTLDALERARRYYVAQCQSYSGTGTSFSRSHTKPHAAYFADRIDRLHEVAERLRRVVVEAMDAHEIIAKYDDPKTCFYVDPPYLPETRTSYTGAASGKYRREMTREQHVQLLEVLQSARGKVLLSGYESNLYRKALRGWRVCWQHRVACASGTSISKGGSMYRSEILWAN